MIKKFILFVFLFPIVVFSMTNTPAGQILETRIFVFSDNSLSIKSNINISAVVKSNFGGSFITVATDSFDVPLGTVLRFTNTIKNFGNHDEIYRLCVLSTNLSGSITKWETHFEDLTKTKITNLGPIARFASSQFVFAVSISNGSSSDSLGFKIGAQVQNNTIATAYVGDNNVPYGGDIGKYWSSGYVVYNTNGGTPSQDDGYITMTLGDLTPPSIPTLVSPVSNFFTNNTNLTFTWNASTDNVGVDHYVIEISSSAAFGSIEATASPVGTSQAFTLTEGTKYWQVRAYDANGNVSANSIVWSVIVDTTPPATPNLASPGNNSFVNSSNQTVVWHPSTDTGSGIYGYMIAVSNASGITYYTNTTSTNEVVSLIEGLNKWSVLALDNADNSAESSEWSVTVDTTGPSTPALSSPANGSKTSDPTPTFSWNASSDAHGVSDYEISIDGGAAQSTSGLTSYTPGSGLSDNSHTWRVRAIDSLGNVGSYSGTWTVVIDTTGPGDVTGASATPLASQINLAWSNPGDSDLTGIRVVRKIGSAPTSTNDGIVVYNSLGTSYNDTGLGNGTHYYYMLYSYDDVGNYSSGVSVDAIPADTTPPGEVSGFSISVAPVGNRLDLSWTNPTDTDFAGVKLLRKIGSTPTSTNDGTKVYDGTGTSYADIGLTDGTTYYYTIFTYDNAGNASSGVSDNGTPADSVAPADASGLNVSVVNTGNELDLSWSNPTDPDFAGVRVVRKTGSAPANESDGTIVYNGTGTSYNDTGLTDGTDYYYGVFSYDEVPNYSSGISANGIPSDSVAPAGVTGLSVSVVATGNALDLSWINPSDSDFANVVVVRKTGSAPANTSDGTTVYTGPGTSYSDTGLTDGTTYYYSVFSADEVPNYSGAVSASGIPADSVAPADVSGLSVSVVGTGNELDISWSNPVDSDFAGVRVVRKVGSAPANISDGTIVYTGTGTSYNDTGLVDGTDYYYGVFSYDEVPNYSAGISDHGIPADSVAPGNASGLVVSVVGAGNALDVSWTNPGDFDFAGVKVIRKVGSAPANISDGTEVYDGTGTSYNDTGLTDGTTYYYGVFSYDEVPNYSSGVSSSGTPADSVAPADASGLNVSVVNTGNELDLTWSNPSDPDFAGVRVVRKTGSAPANESDGTIVYDGTGTSYADTGLTDGTDYYYGVFAYDEVPNYSSGISANGIPSDSVAPAGVTGLSVSVVAVGNALDLSWTNPSDSDFANVVVVRKTGSAPANTSDGTTVYTGSGTSYSDTGLTDGTTYYYSVFSADEVPNYSGAVSASGTPADTTSPAEVSGLSITQLDSELDLSWSNPSDSDFSGVRVVRKTGGYPANISDGTIVYTGTGTSYADTGVVNGTTYYYKVFTKDEVPNWSLGSTVSGTPQDMTPPLILTASHNTMTSNMTLSFNEVINDSSVVLSSIVVVSNGGNSFSLTSAVDTTGGNNSTLTFHLTGSDNTRLLNWDLAGATVTINLAGNAVSDLNSNGISATNGVSLNITSDTTPPGEVSGLSISVAPVGNELDLSWSNPGDSDFSGVRVVRKVGSVPANINDGTIVYTGTGTSYNDTGLLDGTNYYYTLFTYDNIPNYSAGVSDLGMPADSVAPGNASGLVVSVVGAGNALDVSWSNPGDSDFSGVRVVRKVGSAPADISDGTEVYDGTGTSYHDTGLTDGTTYYYGVFSYDEVPNYSSGVSASGTPADSVAPADASGLNVSVVNTGNELDISWSNPGDSDFAGVKVIRKVGSAPANISDGTEVYDGTGTSYADTGLTDGTDYYYGVFAYDEVPNYSSGISANGIPADSVAPAGVTGLNVSVVAVGNALDLSWTNPTNSDFSNVVVVRKTGSAPANTSDGTTVYTGSGTSYSDTGLTDGTTYYYSIFSADEVPNYSGAVSSSGTPADTTAPSDASGFTITIATQGKVLILHWTEPVDSDYSGLRIVQQIGAYPTGIADGTIVDVGTSITSYTDTGLANGTTYYYKLFAKDEVPNWSTGVSNSATPGDAVPPANVTGLSVSVVAVGNALDLSWTNPTDLDFVGVKVVRKIGSAPTNIVDGTNVFSGNATSYHDTGLTDGTTYYYTVFAYDGAPNYSSGTSVSGTPADSAAPSDASGLNVSVVNTGNELDLTWSNPSDTDFAGVKVIRKVGSAPANESDGTIVYDGTGTSYNDTGLTDGTDYYYAVFAYDEVPNYSSGISANGIPADSVAPAGVTGLNVSVVAVGNALDLSWTNPTNSDFSNVVVVRKTGSAPANTSDGTTVYTGSGTSYSDTGLTDGTTYYYSIFSADEVPNYSGAVSSSGTPADTTAPSDASGFTITIATQGKVLILHWTEPVDSDYSGLRIVRQIGAYPTGIADGTGINLAVGNTSYTDTGLVNGTTYYYKIFTRDEMPNWSTGVSNSATPGDAIPPANVTSLTASTNVDNQIDLSWTNPTDPDFAGVKVIRKVGSAPANISDGTEVYDGTNTSYLDTGLLYGNDYYYTVFAYDGAPNYSSGTSTGAIQVKDHTPTADVTGLTANISGLSNQVSLNWINPTDADFTGVRIVIKSNSAPANATNGIVTNVGNITSWTSVTLTTGVTWYFGVYAIDLAGNLSTGTNVNAIPSGLPTGTIVLTDPNGLPSYAHTYSDKTNITVTGYQNATGYIVSITNVNGISTNYVTNDISTLSLLGEGSNIIVITMTNSSGHASPQTNVMILDTQVPSAVSNVIIAGGADSVDNQTVAISIDTSTLSTDVAGYYISEESTPPTANSGKWIMGSVPTNVSFALSEGEGTKTVHVWVIDRAGNMSPATSDSVEYKKIIPADVIRLMANTSINNQIKLSWINPTNSNFAGVIIVRKIGSASINPTDGTKVYDGIGTNYNDMELVAGVDYYYTLFTYDTNTNYSAGISVNATPKGQENNTFKISPNPLLNSEVSAGNLMLIEYGAETGAEVQFEVYTMVGTQVVVIKPDSTSTAHWDGKNEGRKEVASGIYLMIMRVNGKMVYHPLKVGYIRR